MKKERFYKNINTGDTITEKEYLDLLEREAKDMWYFMSDEEKYEEWNNDYDTFCKIVSEDDGDFKLVDNI